MADQRVAGMIQVQVDGSILDAKGNFTYNPGLPKREPVMGTDRMHGYKENPQPGTISGAITDRLDLDTKALLLGKGLTVTIRLGNGKSFMLSNAFFSGDGNFSTEEAEIEVAWTGEGEEIA